MDRGDSQRVVKAGDGDLQVAIVGAALPDWRWRCFCARPASIARCLMREQPAP
ncbi:MAG: hypothetical protein M5R42_13515 [Rhodocyclaceae bacterium]|nr:hypothetical protein [Rhodocyclaceae bacterium]